MIFCDWACDMRGTDDVSLPLIGGPLGGGSNTLDPIFLAHFFKKVLSALGTISKFLSILGDNFFICSL